MTVKPDEIAALIAMFAASGWDELHVESGGLQIFLSTDPDARLTGRDAPVASAPAAAPVAVVAPAPVAAAPAPPPAAGAVQANWVAVKAPNLGTFYRSPKPGSPPFVEIGQRVAADSEICLIEVMKLFTAVRAGVAGIVRQICATDAELVEGDQILFYVEKE